MYGKNKSASIIKGDENAYLITLICQYVSACCLFVWIHTNRLTHVQLVLLTSFEGTLRSNRGVQVGENTLTSQEGIMLPNEWHANYVFSLIRETQVRFPATTLNDITFAET